MVHKLDGSSGSAQRAEVPQSGLETLLVVPSLVESLEHVDELNLAEAIQVGHNGIEFMDTILPVVRIERTALDAHPSGPFAESFVHRREPPGECDEAIPERALTVQSRDGERVQHEESQMRLHEPSRVPVERDGTEKAKQIRFVPLIAARQEKIW